MNDGDEQLLRGRVYDYGYGYDHPNPGPLPHRTYAVLVGGPLDGPLLDISGWRPEEIEDRVALTTELGRWPGGRALYDPPPAHRARRAAREWCAASTTPATHPDRRAHRARPSSEEFLVGLVTRGGQISMGDLATDAAGAGGAGPV